MELSVRDAARLLGVSEKTVYRWARKGEIPLTRVNDQYRFHRVELLEWATARKIPVSPEIYQESADGPCPDLSDALEAGGVFYRIEGTDVAQVLRTVVDHLRLPEEVDREYLYQVLLAREELGSTAVGDGIAIPHPRNPIVLHVPRPTVTLCFLEHPVDFQALDGRPVHILFTLVSPTVRAHLHLLSRLAFCLRDGTLRELLAEPASRDVLHQAFREVERDIPRPPGDTSG
ncbi:MAG: PTS sugar transporter subunit IIA [Deferrisomatales bacterium]|nr:PTS sugar transporter subunit IIA [Deferrisomatales bacterium]